LPVIASLDLVLAPRRTSSGGFIDDEALTSLCEQPHWRLSTLEYRSIRAF